eukprot:GHVU01224985.1.p1 GENE.GHVU01224985.1~~GHVU01224985.1.p1  ORF type:complete len:279 (+),score=24.25 GHVU01224985.1:747-1583(+)
MPCWFTCTSALIGDTRIEGDEPTESTPADELRTTIKDATTYAQSLANHCIDLWNENKNNMIQSLDKMLQEIEGENELTQEKARSTDKSYSENEVQNLYKETTQRFLRGVLPFFDHFKMDGEISKVEEQITTCNEKMADVRASRRILYGKCKEKSVHIGILHVKALKVLEECEKKCIKAYSCHSKELRNDLFTIWTNGATEWRNIITKWTDSLQQVYNKRPESAEDYNPNHEKELIQVMRSATDMDRMRTQHEHLHGKPNGFTGAAFFERPMVMPRHHR